MDRTTLAQEIVKKSYLRGDFLLRSGLRSSEYFDKYRFESSPILLKAIAEHLCPMIPRDTEVLAGLELGGVPIATALSLLTGLPCAFVRKKAKDYGTLKIAEGADLADKKVCVVEDVITTGGQVLLSAKDLEAVGAKVIGIISVIYRGPEKTPSIPGLSIPVYSLFTKMDLTT